MKKAVAVLRRIVVEFALPAAAAGLCTFAELSWGKPLQEYVKSFGFFFLIVAWPWNQVLRIVYQRSQQDKLEALGDKIEATKAAVEEMRSREQELFDRAIEAEVIDMTKRLKTDPAKYLADRLAA